jgi:hypothetical protein
MHRFVAVLSVCGLAVGALVTAPPDARTEMGDPIEGRSADSHGTGGALPLWFEPNLGQTPDDVDFLARAPGYSLFIGGDRAVVGLGTGPDGDTGSIRMRLVGADPATPALPAEPLPARAHYFTGADPADWVTDVPTFGRVEYRNVYPGIDIAWHGLSGRPEYDLAVGPGADPGRILLAFDGARDLRIAPDGDLLLGVPGGIVRHEAPVVYQEIGTQRHPVDGRYVLDGPGRVGFDLGPFDPFHTLVIDPAIVYATQIGDVTSGGNEEVIGVEVDPEGNAFVTGFTTSSDFPVTEGAFDQSVGGVYDAFVLKLDPAGDIVWATFLGGSDWEQGRGIAVDGGGVWVTGLTRSTNFPTRRAFQPAFGGGWDAFVTRLNPQGSALVSSTYLGGSDFENSDGADFLARQGVGGVGVDGRGNGVVTGWTVSVDFPTVNAMQPEIGGGNCAPSGVCKDAFLAKFTPQGNVVFSTYFGGPGTDFGHGVAVQPAGQMVLLGETGGPGLLPTTPGAFQPRPAGITDYFVTKVNRRGSGLVYSSYLGGEGSEFAGSEVAVDGDGSAYVTGMTASFQFPTTPGAFQEEKAGDLEATVTKVNSAGTAMAYSTYLGGLDDELGDGITVDSAGRASITGRTTSGGSYPEVNELEACSAAPEAIATTMSADGSAVLFSTCLGNVMREGASIAELDGDLFVGGITLLGGGATDAMVVRIAD